MFLIFKFLPDWIWLLGLLVSVAAVFISKLPLPIPSTYKLPVKLIGIILTGTFIFLNGMLYADNAWKAAAKELQDKVALAEKQSQEVNAAVKERVVTKLQIVKVRGEETVKYIEKEVAKFNSVCVIPIEFITAHNRAAEVPK